MTTRTPGTYIRINPDLITWIKTRAKEENRSMNNYIETVLIRHRAENQTENKED